MISGVSLEGWIRLASARSKPARIHAIPLQRDKFLVDIADTSFHSYYFVLLFIAPPNGVRYTPSGVLVGGTRSRHFDGASLKPRKVPDCPKGVRTQSLRAAVPPPHLHWRAVPVWLRRSLPEIGCTLCWAALSYQVY